MNNSTKQTVLIVDDQESIRIALSRMLSKEGYEVFMAESGESALDILREKKIINKKKILIFILILRNTKVTSFF